MSGIAAAGRAVARQSLRLHLLTAAAALAVAITPEFDRAAARALKLSFDPPPPTMGEATEILLSNARVVLAILLVGAAASRGFLPQTAARVFTAGLLAANAAAVGAAIGAYGPASTVPWLIHLPLEWTALGSAAAAVGSPAQDMTPARAAAITTPLLAGAAVIETYATPLGL